MRERIIRVLMILGMPIMILLFPLWIVIYIINGRIIPFEYMSKIDDDD